jgi:hypothetical protein
MLGGVRERESHDADVKVIDHRDPEMKWQGMG